MDLSPVSSAPEFSSGQSLKLPTAQLLGSLKKGVHFSAQQLHQLLAPSRQELSDEYRPGQLHAMQQLSMVTAAGASYLVATQMAHFEALEETLVDYRGTPTLLGFGVALGVGVSLTIAGIELLSYGRQQTAKTLEKVADWTKPVSVVDYKFNEMEFQEAMATGNVPKLFIDPVTYGTIEDPVTFIQYDSKGTAMIAEIYDRATIKEIFSRAAEDKAEALHPMTRKPISPNQMIESRR